MDKNEFNWVSVLAGVILGFIVLFIVFFMGTPSIKQAPYTLDQVGQGRIYLVDYELTETGLMASGYYSGGLLVPEFHNGVFVVNGTYELRDRR